MNNISLLLHDLDYITSRLNNFPNEFYLQKNEVENDRHNKFIKKMRSSLNDMKELIKNYSQFMIIDPSVILSKSENLLDMLKLSIEAIMKHESDLMYQTWSCEYNFMKNDLNYIVNTKNYNKSGKNTYLISVPIDIKEYSFNEEERLKIYEYLSSKEKKDFNFKLCEIENIENMTIDDSLNITITSKDNKKYGIHFVPMYGVKETEKIYIGTRSKSKN